jgi:hypothetical protein
MKKMKTKNEHIAVWMTLGLCLGVAIGAVFGALGMGISFGMIAGIIYGNASWKEPKEEKDSNL